MVAHHRLWDRVIVVMRRKHDAGWSKGEVRVDGEETPAWGWNGRRGEHSGYFVVEERGDRTRESFLMSVAWGLGNGWAELGTYGFTLLTSLYLSNSRSRVNDLSVFSTPEVGPDTISLSSILTHRDGYTPGNSVKLLSSQASLLMASWR